MSYDTLIFEPLKGMMVRVIDFIPTLLIALGILVFGWVVSRFIRKLLVRLLDVIGFDVVSDKLGLSRILRIGGIRHKPSQLLACVVYSVLMVMVLLMTVKSFGLTVVSDMVDKVIGYVPDVIAGATVLIIGMLLAKAVSSIIYVTARNTDMPSPETLSHLTKFTIMGYVVIIYLKQIGIVALFTEFNYTVFMTGIVFALALAFGLAGKDLASRYLGVLNVKKGSHK